MTSLEIFILGVSWLGAIALGIITFLLAYLALRVLASVIMRRGLFPTALAPACIIAARLRCTRGDMSWLVAHTVLREIALAERASPEFTKHIEELFPRRHELVEDKARE